MRTLGATSELDNRVAELVLEYSAPSACLAWLLCDRHPAANVAYDVIDTQGNTERLTYGQLKRRSEAFAAGLARIGVRPGDRVATLAGKSAEYLVGLIGIWRLGAVHVPLFTAFAPPAIAQRLAGSHAKVVICDASQVGKLGAIDEDASAVAVTDLIVIGDDEAPPATGRSIHSTISLPKRAQACLPRS